MQDLIQEAGLSVGAVYRYFKSKNEIISAIAEMVAGTITAFVVEIAEREPRLPLDESMRLILAHVDAQVTLNFPLGLQIWAQATLDPAIGDIVRDRYSGMRAGFTTIARRAIEDGELPPDAVAESVGPVLFGLIPGYSLQRLLAGTPDVETYLDGVRALLSRGR